jgi:hypothetical protein
MGVAAENQPDVATANHLSEPLRFTQRHQFRHRSGGPDRRMMDDEQRPIRRRLGELVGQGLELCVGQLAVNLIRDAGVQSDEPKTPDAYHLIERAALRFPPEQMCTQQRRIVVVSGNDQSFAPNRSSAASITGRSRT